MMKGSDLRAWRKLHGLTQEGLRLTLDIGSRQTIHNWEKSDQPVPRLVELAILALQYFPDLKVGAGLSMAGWDHKEQRRRASD